MCICFRPWVRDLKTNLGWLHGHGPVHLRVIIKPWPKTSPTGRMSPSDNKFFSGVPHHLRTSKAVLARRTSWPFVWLKWNQPHNRRVVPRWSGQVQLGANYAFEKKSEIITTHWSYTTFHLLVHVIRDLTLAGGSKQHAAAVFVYWEHHNDGVWKSPPGKGLSSTV